MCGVSPRRCLPVFCPPDREYLDYVDFRTLSILFCLMGAMSGLQTCGVFECAAQALLGRVKRAWQLVLTLDSERDYGLEKGLLKDKADFFEEIFGIRIHLRRKKQV